METRDISLAGRVLATFPDSLKSDQRASDALAELGELAKRPEANIIKLPNISASVPQMKATIAELHAKGFPVPAFDPAKYKKCMGSAVNPVLREGNSDRRAPAAVKAYARANPHRMGKWDKSSKTHVVTMKSGDFCSSELSVTTPKAVSVAIEHVSAAGKATVLKAPFALLKGEVLDSSLMSKQALLRFLDEQVADAKAQGVLFSLHMKATMMKVSDPIIFGHAVRIYFKDVFAKHGATFKKLGVNVNNGFGDLLSKLANLPAAEREEIEKDLADTYSKQADLAMVDSDRGITNLHVPSDVIIDASMPAMIRASGKMWNAAGKEQDCKACIPDSSYAGVYRVVVEDCLANGAFDPTTMGTCPNVGLMAQKAEEYGSHDKTFEIASAGSVRVVTTDGQTLSEHKVEEGDIWRACQTKDLPVRDWVKLAVSRARSTGWPTIFWLDAARAHDAQLIAKVNQYLSDHDTSGLEISIQTPEQACRTTLARIRKGHNTISVTGNVLRDYLTDLFPILEVGTSAKVLSIVPLMAGGGLFETGAGGSAPKHVQQFEKEGHLRWDSLGEFLALGTSLNHVAERYKHAHAGLLARTVDQATERILLEGRSPSRKVNEIDNRGGHFYLALYWAQALAAQKEDTALQAHFTSLAKQLSANEEQICKELLAAQGSPQDLGGYYMLDPAKAAKAMRPSPTLNRIINSGGKVSRL